MEHHGDVSRLPTDPYQAYTIGNAPFVNNNFNTYSP